MTGIEAEFLDDGGQSAADVADRLVSFIAEASATIDVAIYDFDARVGATARIADALEAAAARGVAIRVAFNQEREAEATHNPPMICDPETIDGLEVPTKGVHDQGALMHHKYAVRDGADVWTGSTNWTDDAFSREENAIVRVVVAGRGRELCTQLRAALDQGAPRVERGRGRVGARSAAASTCNRSSRRAARRSRTARRSASPRPIIACGSSPRSSRRARCSARSPRSPDAPRST